MRWIFFSLLLVNVAVFAYMQWEHVRGEPVSVVNEGVSDISRQAEDAPSLTLLSELKGFRGPVESIRIVGDGDQNTASGVARSLCTLVGPFSNRRKAETFVDRLLVIGVESKVKNLLVSSAVGFWLHLPPQSSRKEVLRRLSELQRQGIDSYVIPDGDLANGISLGMFSEQSRANFLKEKIVNLGYQPEILSVPREKRELWVFLFRSESAKISEKKWFELLSGKELLQKQQNLCSGVASS